MSLIRVECEAVWMSGSQESCVRSACSEQARKGHHTGWCVAEDPRKYSVECEVVWASGSQSVRFKLGMLQTGT